MVDRALLTTDPLSRGDGSVAASPPIAPSVDVVSDTAAFVRMESIWNDTVERAPVTHPFLRHEWLRTWWDCFGAGRRLHVLVVRHAGRILAIAPFMWESAWMYGVPVRRLRLLQNDHTPRADVIVAEHPKESYAAIWRSLIDCSERWDVLQLSEVPRSCPTSRAFLTLAAEGGYATGVWQSNDSPYLTLGRSWEAYSASIDRRYRQNLRNRWSRLARLGHPALEVLQDHSAIRDACDDAFRLEASGWKLAAGTAIRSDAATSRFYAELAVRAADRGWLRLLFLTLDGRRIATAYSACYRNRLLFLKTGYSPEFATCSPFRLLTYVAVRDAFTAGLAEVDFLGDREPWKLEWTTTTRPHDWVFIFANTARGRLAHQLKFRIKPAVQRWKDA